MIISGPRQVAKDWAAQSPKATLERDSVSSAARSALRLLVWAKLRGTKDQGIEFVDTPTDPAQLKGKLGAEALEFAFLDRKLFGKPIAYRIPSGEELGL
jgi:hypothetical protein